MEEDEIVVTSTRKKKKTEKKVKPEKTEKKKKTKLDKKTIDTNTATSSSIGSEDLTPTSATSESDKSTSFKQSLPSTPTPITPTTNTSVEKDFGTVSTTTIERKVIREDPVDLLDDFSSVPNQSENVQSNQLESSMITQSNQEVSNSVGQEKLEKTIEKISKDEQVVVTHPTEQDARVDDDSSTIPTAIAEQQVNEKLEEKSEEQQPTISNTISIENIETPKDTPIENISSIEENNDILESTEEVSKQEVNINQEIQENQFIEEIIPPSIQTQQVEQSKPIDILAQKEENISSQEISSTPENTSSKINDISLLSTPPPRFSSSLRDNSELRDNMTRILSILMSHKYASHFNSPVNEKLAEFRDYSKFIKKPIDFTIIKTNFEKSHYVYIDEFIRDIQTVFTNSFMFHLESSPQVRMAKVLQDIFEKELDKVLPYWRAFELSPKVETNDSFSDNDSENSIIAAMESYFISEETSRGTTPEIHDSSDIVQPESEIKQGAIPTSSKEEEVKIQISTETVSPVVESPPKEESEKISPTQEQKDSVISIQLEEQTDKIETIEEPKLELTVSNIAQLSENVSLAPPLNRVDLEVDSLLGSESADSDTLSEFEEDATEIDDADQPPQQEQKVIIVDFDRNVESAQKLLTASEMYSFFKSYIHPLLKSEDLQISMKAKKDRYENILERMQYSERKDIIIEDTLPHSTSLLDVSILAEKVRYREDRLKLKEIQISNKCEIQEQIYKKKEKELMDQRTKIETELESKRSELSNKQIEFENKISQMQQEIEALKQSLEQTKVNLKTRESENEIIKQEIQLVKQSLEQANEQLGTKDAEIETLKSNPPTTSNTVALADKESQTTPVKREESDDFVFVEKMVPPPSSTISNKSTTLSAMDNRDLLFDQNNDEALTEDGSDIMSIINDVDYQLILEEDEQAKNAQKLDQTKQIQLQGDKCPCGREIWKDYGFLKKPRYCNYTNKYYCTKCHSNTCTEVIPAKILGSWDFKPYKVCDEASKYLKSVHRQPIICVSAIKPTLFDEIQNLGAARMIRKRLIIQWEYVSRCPMKDNLIKQHNLQHRLHYLTDTEMYSIKNLEELNMKQVDSPFLQKLSKLFHILSEHIINQCGLCQTKAKNLCASCATGPIYDFNISQVIKCQSCKLVFHKGCFTNNNGVVACPICSSSDN
ncbi:bromodomain-containing protein [Naegleria gruberi]|uniref:Bromodomain-containing protein n=1 Tax=Naegleria gruberi TaxID=5762 RepID=D2UZU6_NAEGR|nr:bromodomain-containing protein [Naegleria gruberi]EFC50223.1 bromodomain-containing protein [Naegleria gruberi]|eukprot:XP_002682967.1 bromodomain-containing protein [Naegleria gruberi strain NEG-M]